MTARSSNDEMLEAIQRDTFAYFLDQTNPANGLVSDTTEDGAPASIAVIGFALAAYPVGVERGFWTRAQAVERTLTTLRFFRDSPQGAERCDRLPRVLLPLSGYVGRTASEEVRAFHY